MLIAPQIPLITPRTFLGLQKIDIVLHPAKKLVYRCTFARRLGHKDVTFYEILS